MYLPEGEYVRVNLPRRPFDPETHGTNQEENRLLNHLQRAAKRRRRSHRLLFIPIWYNNHFTVIRQDHEGNTVYTHFPVRARRSVCPTIVQPRSRCTTH